MLPGDCGQTIGGAQAAWVGPEPWTAQPPAPMESQGRQALSALQLDQAWILPGTRHLPLFVTLALLDDPYFFPARSTLDGLALLSETVAVM